VKLIHIPKTAGSWVGRVCPWTMPEPRTHLCVDERLRENKDFTVLKSKNGIGNIAKIPHTFMYKHVDCFSIVRHPLDWLISYYNHNRSHHIGWNNCRDIHGFKTFKEFVMSYCDPDFRWHVPILKNFMTAQLFDSLHICVVRKILYFETLLEGLRSIFPNELIGNEAFKCLKYDYDQHYDQEMIKAVLHRFKREMTLYGYSLDGRTDNDLCLVPDINHRYDTVADRHYMIVEM